MEGNQAEIPIQEQEMKEGSIIARFPVVCGGVKKKCYILGEESDQGLNLSLEFRSQNWSQSPEKEISFAPPDTTKARLTEGEILSVDKESDLSVATIKYGSTVVKDMAGVDIDLVTVGVNRKGVDEDLDFLEPDVLWGLSRAAIPVYERERRNPVVVIPLREKDNPNKIVLTMFPVDDDGNDGQSHFKALSAQVIRKLIRFDDGKPQKGYKEAFYRTLGKKGLNNAFRTLVGGIPAIDRIGELDIDSIKRIADAMFKKAQAYSSIQNLNQVRPELILPQQKHPIEAATHQKQEEKTVKPDREPMPLDFIPSDLNIITKSFNQKNRILEAEVIGSCSIQNTLSIRGEGDVSLVDGGGGSSLNHRVEVKRNLRVRCISEKEGKRTIRRSTPFLLGSRLMGRDTYIVARELGEEVEAGTIEATINPKGGSEYYGGILPAVQYPLKLDVSVNKGNVKVSGFDNLSGNIKVEEGSVQIEGGSRKNQVRINISADRLSVLRAEEVVVERLKGGLTANEVGVLNSGNPIEGGVNIHSIGEVHLAEVLGELVAQNIDELEVDHVKGPVKLYRVNLVQIDRVDGDLDVYDSKVEIGEVTGSLTSVNSRGNIERAGGVKTKTNSDSLRVSKIIKRS